jgi:hypothetical protein
MNANKQKRHDISVAKHEMYISMKLAGVLVNGHLRRGQKEINRYKNGNKNACRKYKWEE